MFAVLQDGTKEFTLGFVHYVTVLIGVSIRGRAVGGVVHVPFVGGKYVRKHDPLNTMVHKETKAAAQPGQTIWGAVGVGVFGAERLDPADVAPDRRFITTTRTHFSPALAAVLDKLKPQQIIRCGGAGSKGLLVITREADAYARTAAHTRAQSGPHPHTLTLTDVVLSPLASYLLFVLRCILSWARSAGTRAPSTR